MLCTQQLLRKRLSNEPIPFLVPHSTNLSWAQAQGLRSAGKSAKPRSHRQELFTNFKNQSCFSGIIALQRREPRGGVWASAPTGAAGPQEDCDTRPGPRRRSPGQAWPPEPGAVPASAANSRGVTEAPGSSPKPGTADPSLLQPSHHPERKKQRPANRAAGATQPLPAISLSCFLLFSRTGMHHP